MVPPLLFWHLRLSGIYEAGANDIDCGGRAASWDQDPGLLRIPLDFQIHTWEFHRRAAVGRPPHIVTLYPSLLYVSRMILVAHPVTCVIDKYMFTCIVLGFGWVLLNKGQC